MNQHQIRQDTINQYGDAPTNALEALAHVVAVHENTPDNDVMVLATNNIYGPGTRTGLTMGDLRELLRRVNPNKATCLLDGHDYDNDPEDITLHACMRPGCSNWYRD